MRLPERSAVFAICIAIAGLTWFVFGQTLHHAFINFDDPDYVVQNPHVTAGLTSSGIIWAFTHIRAANWHPLTWLSHIVDYQLYGFNPWGHHLTNVVLHAATAILLFLLLRDATGALWRSTFVALLFAIHPLRVESVAWVAERKDVLSGLFFMLTLMAYVRYARARSATGYSLVLLFFALGLISKPILVTTPLVLLLLDVWPLRRASGLRVLLLEKLPLVGLSLVSCAITLVAQRSAAAEMSQLPFSVRVTNAITSYATYLWQLVWPADLAPFYPFPKDAPSLATLVIATTLVFGISMLVYRLRARRYLTTGWLWYLIMLLPVIGLLQVGEQSHADRYTYLPEIGICVAITWSVADLCANRPTIQTSLASVALLLIILLSFAARTQAAYWRDSITLWQHALAVVPENSTARKNLAHAFYEQGNFERAITNYQRAIALDPGKAQIHNNFGVALLAAGRKHEAITEFNAALALQPRYAQAYSNLGLALLDDGKTDQAVNEFQEALTIAPDLPDAHYNFANALLASGNVKDAAVQYRSTLALNPRDERALNNLAWILATSADETVRNATEAVTLALRADALTSHSDPTIQATLAAAYAADQQFAKAIEAAERAIALANNAGESARAAAVRQQLDTYRAGRPFRDYR